MPKVPKPKKFTLGLYSVLFDRGTTHETKDGGWFRTVVLPDIHRLTTANDGPMDFYADGSPARETTADLTAEFDAAEVAARAPKL